MDEGTLLSHTNGEISGEVYVFFLYDDFRDATCHKQGFLWVVWAVIPVSI